MSKQRTDKVEQWEEVMSNTGRKQVRQTGQRQVQQAARKPANRKRSTAGPIPGLDDVLEKRLKKSQQQREWRIFLIQTIAVMLAVYLLLTLVLGILVIHGDSMKPSYNDGDLAIIWRMGKYESGDVVLLESPASPDALVKRIVAGPGDIVEIAYGKVIVNNVILDEQYIYAETHERENGPEYPLVLGEGEYFALGDNRETSLDSRHGGVGVIHEDAMIGRLILIFRAGGR
jgi:signal peptidase I, bacterial type